MLRRLFVFVVCLMAAVATASAQTPPYNEIWYTTTDGRPLFINSGYKESVGLYMYSDTYNNGRGVLKFKSGGYINFINSGLFNGNDRLKSIAIPNSVTSIGYDAFVGCSSLTSITIPNSVTSISWYAFYGCSSLKSFKGKYASSDGRCLIIDGELIAFAPAGLTSYTIPESVTSIVCGAFSGCSSLTSITIPNSITSIGESAFYPCDSLTSITIGNSVTSIGRSAFRGCSSLTSITIPNSVKSIDRWAFKGCSSLKSITIPDSVKSIEYSAFAGCSSLTSITIPNSVKSIDRWAFKGCSSLKSITIPNSVTSIGDEAFEGCSSLKSVKVASEFCYDYFKKLGVSDITFAVSTLEEYEEAQKLGATKLAIDSNSKYASKDGLCLIDNGKLILFIGKDLTEYTIPESVTNFGEEAFKDCSNLKSVKVANKDCYDYFKDKVANIAFYGANASDDGRCLILDGKLIRFAPTGLTSYTIPNSMTSIGRSAFRGCSSLTSITISNSVTSIEYGAFEGCSSLTSITIPNSVTSIGYKAFEGCYALKDVNVNITNLAEYCKGNAIYNIPGNKHLYIDNKEITELVIPNSVTEIEDSAFYRCDSLTSITIPNSVISIGKGAFEDCSSLKSVKVANEYCYDYFKDEVANIAFYGANASDDGRCLILDGKLIQFAPAGLTSYTIPNSVTNIGRSAFRGCSSLTSITIPNSVTSIGEYAFAYCSSLKSITISDSVTSIESGAFDGCDALKDVNVNITNLAKYCKGNAIYNIPGNKHLYINNKEITELVIPNSVTCIGEVAFLGCSSLKSITIGNSVTSIGESAFRGCDSLTSITCLATTPPAIDDLMIGETTMIYVPKKGVKAYKQDPKWSIYKKQIKPNK